MSLPETDVGRKVRLDTDIGQTGRKVCDGATELPDVTGMSTAEAAEAYAKARIHVVPIKPGTKNPGSYLGVGWPARATCDLGTIREWYQRWPDAGIAIHVGGSGLLVIDVDKPENVPDWLWPHLERAVFRRTVSDPNSRRGHYIYKLRPGELFSNGLGRLKPPRNKKWGEIRCYGGGLVLAPTPHPRAAEGGQYSSGPTERIPFRPDDIAAKLSAPANAEEWRMLTPRELGEKARTFLGTYTEDKEPHALAPILAGFDPTPGGRHGNMWDQLCWALREAKAGRFAAKRAVDELRELWSAAFSGEGRQPDPGEFDRMVRDAVPIADEEGVEVLWERAHRNLTKSKERSQASRLVDIALELYQVGISTDGKPFGYSPLVPHIALDLRGGKLGLRQTLARDYFKLYNSAATQTSIAAACNVLEGMARDMPPTPLHLRVAGDQTAVYIDLADTGNRVLKISAGKWQIGGKSPYMFRRTELTKAMPDPVRNGDLAKLWAYINIRAEDKPMLVAILVDALINPSTAKPITAFTGEHGTAKSASATRFVSLVDPSDVPLHSPPKDLEHWFSSAAGSWVTGLDNMSSIPDWLSDAFCRASTGSGSVKRALYTDDNLSVAKFRRCVVFNGIDFGGMRGDLADRLISFDLQQITEGNRKTDADLESAWPEDWPAIFGGLLDIAAEIHGMLPTLPAQPLPRMADFAQVLICVDKIAGSDGMSRYRDRLSRAMVDSAVSDSFVGYLVDARYDTTDDGQTAGEILTVVNRLRTVAVAPEDWPRSTKAVTARLKRNGPALRSMGWHVSNDGGYNESGTIKWTVKPPSEDGEK